MTIKSITSITPKIRCQAASELEDYVIPSTSIQIFTAFVPLLFSIFSYLQQYILVLEGLGFSSF